jgi:hypothetical protein
MSATPDNPLDCPCPHCGHRVRVPTELQGQMVQCPQCERPFTAPIALSLTAHHQRSVAGVPWSLVGPGVVLLLLSLWGAYVCGRMVQATFVKADELRADFDARMEKAKTESGQQIPKLDGLVVMRSFLAVLTVLTLLSAAGAVAMLRRRHYWLAVLGCLAALVNPTPLISGFHSYLCLPAAPFAVWGLVGLLRPAGRAAFRRPTGG